MLQEEMIVKYYCPLTPCNFFYLPLPPFLPPKKPLCLSGVLPKRLNGCAKAHPFSLVSSCSKLIAIKLCTISEMHATVRRESVAGYATDETLVCGPKEHTRWWQRYRGHLQGLLYRLILNSYLYLLLQSCLSELPHS